METKKKKTLKQAFDISFKIDIEEVLDKGVVPFGSGAHIIVPFKHRGKKAKVIIYQ